VSQIYLTARIKRPVHLQIRSNQWRAAKSGENASLLPGNIGDCPRDLQPNSACLWIILGEALCERTDQVAIGVEAENFKPGDSSLAETAPVTLDGSFLGCVAHVRPPLSIPCNISGVRALRKKAKRKTVLL
jgi:hypothetical protein